MPDAKMSIRSIVTDPKDHSNDDFVYLVSTFFRRDLSGPTDLEREFTRRIGNILNGEAFYRASLIGHMITPVAARRLQYHGEIGHTWTIGDFGLIVKPASDGHICVASRFDIATPWSQAGLSEWVTHHNGRVEPPVMLLTEAVVHNEVVVRGENDKGQIEGVYLKQSAEGNEKQNVAVLMTLLRSRYGIDVPLVVSPSYETYSPTRQQLADFQTALKSFT